MQFASLLVGAALLALCRGDVYTHQYVSGYNQHSQLESNAQESGTYYVSSFTKTTGLSIASAELGYYVSLRLDSDGTLYSRGQNHQGNLGQGSTTYTAYSYTFAAVNSMDDVPALMACGFAHCIAVTVTPTVYAWGDNKNGQCAQGTGTATTVTSTVTAFDKPTEVVWGTVTAPTGIVSVAAAYYTSMLLGDDGTLYTWGGNDYGALGVGDDSTTTPFTTTINEITGSSSTPWVSVFGGFNDYEGGFAILDSDGAVKMTGYNGYYVLAQGTSTTSLTSPTAIQWQPTATEYEDYAEQVPLSKVSIGYYHTLALAADGTDMFSWGSNYGDGNLGVGNAAEYVYRYYPAHVNFGDVFPEEGIVDIGALYRGSLALGGNGQLYVWGYDYNGAYGLGMGMDYFYAGAPVPNPNVLAAFEAKILTDSYRNVLIVANSASVSPSPSPTRFHLCGNGLIDVDTEEVCDTGSSLVGCAADCRSVKDGYSCTVGTATTATKCYADSAPVQLDCRLPDGTFSEVQTTEDIANALGVAPSQVEIVAHGTVNSFSNREGKSNTRTAACLDAAKTEETVVILKGDASTATTGVSLVSQLAALVKNNDQSVQNNGLCIAAVTYASQTVEASNTDFARTYSKDLGVGISIGVGVPVCLALILGLVCCCAKKQGGGFGRKAAAPKAAAPVAAAAAPAPAATTSSSYSGESGDYSGYSEA